MAESMAFFTVMAAFNGSILLVLVRSAAAEGPPATAVIAANATAWLAGFFAIFAPGGLVVREACLAGLLGSWMPMEQALAVALAWRLVQIVAEVISFAAVAAAGLPTGPLRRPAAGIVEARGAGMSGIRDDMPLPYGPDASVLGVT